MKKYIILTIVSICSLYSSNVYAQVNPQERIQSNQQRLIEEEFRRKELEDALKQPTAERIAAPQKSIKPQSETCLNIKEIRLSGNKKIKNLQDITAKYINKCLSLPEIDALLQEITNAYINQGYITSRAYMTMPQKNIKKGILEIRVIEGKISRIEGMENGELFTAFPFLNDKILNIRDIEQGLDQINRLPSNHATMDIKADEQENNKSKIIISNKLEDRIGATLFSDNAGSESTGETRFGLRGSLDNLFGINDQLNLTYTNSPSKSSEHRNANSLALGFSVPFGYWTFTNNFSWSNYLTSFLLVNNDRFFSYGNSVTNDLSIERLLSRGQKYKVSAGGGLILKSNNNFSRVLDFKVKNKISSRRLSILHFELPTTFYTPYGVVYMKPSYYQGINALGAMNDHDFNYSQKAQYRAWRLYGYYSNFFGKVNYTATFDSQYSGDELFGSEAFLIGGEYTVRGFKEDSMQGDSGYTLRNDAKISLAQAFNSQNAILQTISAGVFLDYGYVHSNNKNIKSAILSGAGAKLEVNYKFFEGYVSYAEPLHKEEWMEENHVWYLYAGISGRF